MRNKETSEAPRTAAVNNKDLEDLGEEMIKDILAGGDANANNDQIPDDFRENFNDFLSQFRRKKLQEKRLTRTFFSLFQRL